MGESVAREFERFVAAERRAGRIGARPLPVREGQVFDTVFVEAGKLAEFARVAARRGAGLLRPTARSEIVWVEGASELAIDIVKLDVRVADGVISVMIPVRSDQTGSVLIQVLFAVGSANEPAGLYAATQKRPSGPDLIVDVWGDALVAFAWQCVLGVVTGIAAATGKDERGNVLVPVELVASARGVAIVPMARHRFAGSTTLKPVGTLAQRTKEPRAGRARRTKG